MKRHQKEFYSTPNSIFQFIPDLRKSHFDSIKSTMNLRLLLNFLFLKQHKLWTLPFFFCLTSQKHLDLFSTPLLLLHLKLTPGLRFGLATDLFLLWLHPVPTSVHFLVPNLSALSMGQMGHTTGHSLSMKRSQTKSCTYCKRC